MKKDGVIAKKLIDTKYMDETRVLINNKVSHFILRIDVDPASGIQYDKLVNDLKPKSSSYKVELHTNFNIDVNKQQVNKQDFLKHILGFGQFVRLYIDTFLNAIIIDASHYETNTVYKAILGDIIQALTTQDVDVYANRVGMRFINTFPCTKREDISKVFKSPEAKAIKDGVDKESVSRVMVVEEFQEADYMKRVQLGIPNKFYPAVITNLDLTLDIDVYTSGRQQMSLWSEIVSSCNHIAYDTFVSYVKDSYLDSMK